MRPCVCGHAYTDHLIDTSIGDTGCLIRECPCGMYQEKPQPKPHPNQICKCGHMYCSHTYDICDLADCSCNKFELMLVANDGAKEMVTDPWVFFQQNWSTATTVEDLKRSRPEIDNFISVAHRVNTVEALRHLVAIVGQYTEGEDTLKKDRQIQWGNKTGQPRGWDRWRASTFLEMIGAKADRATQAQNIGLDNPEKKADALFDAVDSLKDVNNYSGKLLQKIEQGGEGYFFNLRMK